MKLFFSVFGDFKLAKHDGSLESPGSFAAFPAPVPCPRVLVPSSPTPNSLSPVPCPQFPIPRSLPPVPCPKFPVPSLLPPVPCPPGEEGPKDTATLVVGPLPWDDEEVPGRVLKKTPPPTTAVRVEPQQKKARFEEESVKRPRRGEPARDSGGASSSGRDGYMDLVERRIEKVQVGKDYMHHLDEVIDVETMRRMLTSSTRTTKRIQCRMEFGVRNH